MVFPGQGAQYSGMGEELTKVFPQAKAIYQRASEKMGYDMEALCFQGSEKALKETRNTQPSVLTTCIAIYKVLETYKIPVHGFAGLSLGEYGALVASNALQFEDAVQLVQKRASYMQEAVPEGIGTMAAILGLEASLVKKACKMASKWGVVEPANYNCPLQLVISGEGVAVQKAMDICKTYGAKKAVFLSVSAPFHSSMLKKAGVKLGRHLENISFSPLSKPVVSNVEADYISSHKRIKELLVQQVSHPVRWEESIKKLIEDGYDAFIEVGPGRALSKFIRRISKSVKICNIENMASLEKTRTQLVENSI